MTRLRFHGQSGRCRPWMEIRSCIFSNAPPLFWLQAYAVPITPAWHSALPRLGGTIVASRHCERFRFCKVYSFQSASHLLSDDLGPSSLHSKRPPRLLHSRHDRRGLASVRHTSQSSFLAAGRMTEHLRESAFNPRNRALTLQVGDWLMMGDFSWRLASGARSLP
jgi:hypothetical protein